MTVPHGPLYLEYDTIVFVFSGCRFASREPRLCQLNTGTGTVRSRMATPLQEARVDTKKPHTKDKSPNHHKTTDEETCLLYSLCVKHLSPEGWKRQHRSQLSAVPCAPFHRLGCVFCINKRMDVPSLGT